MCALRISKDEKIPRKSVKKSSETSSAKLFLCSKLMKNKVI